MQVTVSGAACSRGDGDADDGDFLREGLTGALAVGDFVGDEAAEVAIDFLLVGTVADAADEKVGTMADEEPVFRVPLDEFEVVGFHGWTSRMADFTSFS